jgi:hypothetical protein
VRTRSRPVHVVLVGCAVALASAACASRGVATSPPIASASPRGLAAPLAHGVDRAAIEAGLARSKRETPHVAMLSDEAAHEAMPALFKGREMPYLLRAGGLQPKTMASLMAFAKEMRTEGGLDRELLDDVFWVVSHVNDCFY